MARCGLANLAVVVILAGCEPGWAITTDVHPAENSIASGATKIAAPQSGGDNADTSLQPNKKKSAHHNFAHCTLGIVTGIVIGIPVCAVRKPIDEDKNAVGSLAGSSKKNKVVVPSAIFWTPFAAVAGVLEAPFYALNNSLVNADKPFSKEQLSLKEKHSGDTIDSGRSSTGTAK